MKMIFAYITFSISIIFISWIIGMMMTALLKKTNYYNNGLSNLNFLKSQKFNYLIGIGVIKWIVKNTFFKFFNQKLKVNKKINISDLTTLRMEMTRSEIDHLFAFLFVMIFVVLKIVNHEYLFALIILAVNCIMNLYPSLLQQQNKRRIDKLIVKLQNASNGQKKQSIS